MPEMKPGSGLLQDKVAVVTGAARGIGLGIAQCLAEEGARIAIIDLDAGEATAAAKNLHADGIGFAADASRDAEMTAAADRIAAHFGGIDFFVNNAGGARPDRPEGREGIGNPFTKITERGWDEQVETNLRTTFAGCKAAIPHLQKRGGGAIVNIASIAGQMAMVSAPAYGAAKAGVLSLTRSLALELAGKQIRVNAICPGMLWTRAWEAMAEAMKQSVPAFASMAPRDIFAAHIRKLVPMGAEQTPEDIGRLTAFLCSDGAKNLTGQCIALDGGQTLRTGTG
jgi:NAD(P)-dependent dehydrogenase (short-subunit alcohol dehydrogenase family)